MYFLIIFVRGPGDGLFLAGYSLAAVPAMVYSLPAILSPRSRRWATLHRLFCRLSFIVLVPHLFQALELDS